MEFKKFPKIPRFYRDIVITEKLDGTNGAIVFDETGALTVQSRNRAITPDDDNYGFARWATEHAGALWDVLGHGYHYGEWWGWKINRGYGLPPFERRFSLFNTVRWGDQDLSSVPGLGVVPVLYEGAFTGFEVSDALNDLVWDGSHAAPGFDNPEGIVIYHKAAGQLFKVLAEQDQVHKSQLSLVA